MSKRKQDTKEEGDTAQKKRKHDEKSFSLSCNPPLHETLSVSVSNAADSICQHGNSEDYSEEEKLSSSGWRQWGCFLAERQWGTVREDTSSDGNCWESFSFKDSSFKAYCFGEDGLFGFCDDKARLCFSVALWNEKDSRLKERLFGLSNPEGNHGEDVKEVYQYLCGLPSNSYMKAMYRYPHSEFPYDTIIRENARRSRKDPEYEIEDTGVFHGDRFHDVYIEYAKGDPNEMLCCITAVNCGSKSAPLHVLPTAWFRNTWSLGCCTSNRPLIHSCNQKDMSVLLTHPELGSFELRAVSREGLQPEVLFTQNESNEGGEFNQFKDAFHQHLITGKEMSPLSEINHCTKCAFHFKFEIPAHETVKVKIRLRSLDALPGNFDAMMVKRMNQHNDFYSKKLSLLSSEEQKLCREAYAGLCWSKQFYLYDMHVAFKSTAQRNSNWMHMRNHDVILVPDKWEFPWYAAWDLAFHVIAILDLDVKFAQQQLLLFLSDRYQHPNGQIPACEFDFSDVNPPVHAWACVKVHTHSSDSSFLEKCFPKLKNNFQWFLSRSDDPLMNCGFLGMDNVSCVNRSCLPAGCSIRQADAAAWLAFNALNMMDAALHLSSPDAVYFLVEFFKMADKLKDFWCSEDGFFYDILKEASGKEFILRIHSMVGLLPLIASIVIVKDRVAHSKEILEKLQKCGEYVMVNSSGDFLISALSKSQMSQLVDRILDEEQFLAPCGIRSLSKFHKNNPYTIELSSEEKFSIEYNPGESRSGCFGGNSNWQGPVWMPVNYLLLENLQAIASFFGDGFCFESESSDKKDRLQRFTRELQSRIISNFIPQNGNIPVQGKNDLHLFYEFFNGDTGRGCGASHQTGWTALVACSIRQQSYRTHE